MRFSKLVNKTLKETPKDAEVISHQLMTRAGMIRKVGSGIYVYMPLGQRVLKKIQTIVCEELDLAGAQELLMPVLQPVSLWHESGRYEKTGKELMTMTDRHNNEFILGPTHEEVITDIIKNTISSYKELPLNVYQIQTKFRDEVRPRFGLMRGREFLMKDGYSFHLNHDSLEAEYENMHQAYNRIFERLGLKFRAVEADSGNIGGSKTHEIHVLASSGEDEILYCNHCDYAANIEKAVAHMAIENESGELKASETVETPNRESIEDVANFLDITAANCAKAVACKTEKGFVLVLLRGDYEVNEIKLKNLLDVIDLEWASEEEMKSLGMEKGYIGPIGIHQDVKIILDTTLESAKNYVVGANVANAHIINVNHGRDFTPHLVADIHSAKVGDGCTRCLGGTLESARGIEVGQIFQLGTKYSESMNLTVIGEDGKPTKLTMGCYGIGVSRTMAAVIEQNNDDFGIVWPMAIAPFEVNIMAANPKDEEQVKMAESLYTQFRNIGVDTIIDDRNERIGFKLKDSDLIGIPVKIIVGKSLAEGSVEVKLRKGGDMLLAVGEVVATVKKMVDESK